jgi:putative membrane protein insertion efficiency factor
MNFLKKLPNKLVIGLITIYRFILSPSVGFLRFLPFYPKNTCIFYPTCSEYGVECFKKYPFFTALRKTISRIGRCHPGNEPGVDLP